MLNTAVKPDQCHLAVIKTNYVRIPNSNSNDCVVIDLGNPNGQPASELRFVKFGKAPDAPVSTLTARLEPKINYTT